MNSPKYVIINGGLFGEETAIIFDATISHDIFKNRAISAGFVAFSKNKEGKIVVQAYGKSDSLNLKSRQEDSKLICRALNPSGFDFDERPFIIEEIKK